MPLVVPVKFTYASRDLWFDPQDLDILEADYAICSTERGTEIGLVTADPFEVPQDEIGQPLKPVLRVASDIDLQLADDLAIQGDEAMVDFRRLVKELDLEMKPVGVEYLFGGEKAVFYFAAEERVDFASSSRICPRRCTFASTCARSACATRPAWWAAMPSADRSSAARALADSLSPSRFAWQKSKTCRSIPPRSAACAVV